MIMVCELEGLQALWMILTLGFSGTGGWVGWPPGPEESVAAVALGNELLDGDLQAGLRIAQNCRIWSPNLGVFAVSAAGVLCAFPAWWTRYLDSVSAARLAHIHLSLLFLEQSGYGVNAVQRHVNAADVLVRRGGDRDGSR
jgi:hypothetical protein